MHHRQGKDRFLDFVSNGWHELWGTSVAVWFYAGGAMAQTMRFRAIVDNEK